jgi:hypothetical protein
MKNLTRSGNIFAETMKKKITEVRAPSNIGEHISVGSAQKKGNQYSIDVSIDISEGAAPEAPAYEWGSGEHRTRGSPGLYPIEAKNVPNLVFWWEKGQKWFVGAKLPYGHPGVAPRPYIEPSIQESTPKIKEILGKNFKASILVGVPKVEVISAEK